MTSERYNLIVADIIDVFVKHNCTVAEAKDVLICVPSSIDQTATVQKPE